MNKQLNIKARLFKTICLFVFLSLSLTSINAQSRYSASNKILLHQERYHLKSGWVNSVGVNVSPFAPLIIPFLFVDGIGQTLPDQFEYLSYYLVKPKLGLGLSVTYSRYPTSELGYEYFTHYSFINIGAYAKVYLNDDRRRPFFDLKLGYGIAHDNPIGFGCFHCDKVGTLYLRYASGMMFQPGFGIDFATRTKIKWGVKLSASINPTTQQRDRHENGWETTPTGIIKRTTTEGALGALFLGFNIYI